MSKALYFECNTGISGDMTVAALLDLGADRSALEKMLSSLPLSGFKTEITRVKKAGLDMCDFNVILEQDNHDHDLDYLHGLEQEHHHEHHGHTHRNLTEILHILSHADMTPGAFALAQRIFQILAQAEAKAHGVPVEQVHFHEVGAVDSIVDIASAAVLLDSLQVKTFILSSLCEGTGSVRCQHGVLPVPVPAVIHIAEQHGLPMVITQMQGELVTPTGAAIVAAIVNSNQLPERFRILKTGMGAGKRAYQRPSFLRLMLIEQEQEQRDTIIKLETNVDDCTGEALGYVMKRLMDAGAKDAYFTPVYMKKNRPGYLLSVLCQPDQRETLEAIIFNETTTIGIRRQTMERTVLQRQTEKMHTNLGEATFKYVISPEGERWYPEYESIVEICQKTGRSFQSVLDQLQQERQSMKSP